jgi:excinuclease ABC subunit C
MKSTDLKKKDIPDNPGVYLFKGAGKEILYIGKATSLRDRVRSYFSSDLREARTIRIEKMVEEATGVDWQETDSVLEALILEANLIKKHQPFYNIREKDNKSWNYVVITKEDFPRVVLVRGRELSLTWDPDDIKYSFGPYPHTAELREALKIIRKIFPFRGERDAVKGQKRKSRLYEEIGLAPKIASGEVSRKDYQNTINNLRLFFEGKKGKLLKKLVQDMKRCAREEKFEEAERIKRQIFALEHIKDVSLIKTSSRDHSGNFGDAGVRIEGYDIAHIAGTSTAGVMVVVEDSFPVKNEYRKFKIKNSKKGSDTDALREVLERRLNHIEWPLPKLFVIDGGKGQKNTAEEVLSESGVEIPVVSVVKDDRHKVLEILGNGEVVRSHETGILIANAESHRFAQNYHKTLRGKFGIK